MDQMPLTWLGLALALAGIGATSALETALVGLPSARVHAAIDARRAGARLLGTWLRRPGLILGTLHLLRSGLTVGLGVVLYLTLQRLELRLASRVAWGTLLVLAISATHLAMRAAAKRAPLELATRGMWLILLLTGLLLPVSWPLALLGRALARLFGVPVAAVSPFWTADELSQLTQEAQAASLGARGEDLLLSMIEFSDTVIREIMVPRTEMVTIARGASRDEVQQLVLDAGHSRIPVYDDTIDNIIGVLHIKDLFVAQLQRDGGQKSPDFALAHMLRPTFYVPEVMKISELLRDFQRRKTHLAIVVDEYGGTAGVVTLEDILEEIVGEIQDEYDVDEKQFRQVGDKIIADGRVSIWDLEEALQVSFPDDADYETLAGFLMSRTGMLPEAGTVITWNALRFVVKEANPKRVGTVEIERVK
ncbi:MAG: HlyC/CorC family transporter [Deltaproteobacteria bacterium]|nr:MAG: HlyC/CorC family transporter [Deltaproteobacteria bacterium]